VEHGTTPHGGGRRGGAGQAEGSSVTEVGEDPRVGRSGLCRPIGQLGRCEVFGPGEEWREGWPDGLGAMVGFPMKNQEKEKG
jgi:hypothetical protein